MMFALVRRIAAVIGFLPPVFVAVVFAWSTFAYIFEFCVNVILPISTTNAATMMVIALSLEVLAVWSFAAVVLTQPGRPPQHFVMTLEAYEDAFPPGTEVPSAKIRQVIGEDIVVVMRTHDGRPRYCLHCQSVKPDRTHHCSVCDQCVLRMDHHCVFINNCVGFNNHKAFYLFVLYGFFYAFWILITAAPALVAVMQTPDQAKHVGFQWAMLVFLSGVFSLCLFVFTAMHTRIILENRTSIERASPLSNETSRWLYDVDRGYNWRSFMGDNPWAWFLPIHLASPSHNDGYTYSRFTSTLDDEIV